MNLLLVSYHFPPLGGSGVQRPLKLARYWDQLGARVHVLTAAHEHYPLLDPSLLEQVPASVQIHRVRGLEPGGLAATVFGGGRPAGTAWYAAAARGVQNRLYWRLERWCGRLGLPEAETLWTRAAIRAARRLAHHEKIDAVITTSPPHSVQRVGMALKQDLGIPWIADLRDPIVDNFAQADLDRRKQTFWSLLEADIVSAADRVIVTCPDLAGQLRSRYAAVPADRYATITNGYDPADAPAGGAARPARGRRFVLAHVGSFYREQSIAPLLEAARAVLARRPDWAGQFQLRIVGSLSGRQKQHLRESDAAWLHVAGYVSHAQAVREMASADALFLMTPVNEQGRFCIPAKTFEYLAFGSTVLALVHRDAGLESLLHDAGGALMVHHGDIQGLSAALERLISRCTSESAGDTIAPRNPAVVRHYARDRLAAEYLELIRDTVRRATASRPSRARTPVGGRA